MFSILIPSFNNLEYLKTCINSLKKNSEYAHQIIVHINEGTDGSLEYIKENNLEYTYSENNIGMPKALNKSSKLANLDYILISHDDFYFCPGWDTEFVNELKI
jgi:GT2 family glycosyltransferase